MKQLAYFFKVDTFHPEIPDSKWFLEMNQKKVDWLALKKTVKFTSNDIISLGKKNFIDSLHEEIDKGKHIILQAPLLGEVFYDYIFTNPNNIINIKSDFCISNLDNAEGIKNIAIHFRGTDFEAWNKEAILDLDYYMNAIDYCIEYFQENKIVFHIFTDDLKLNTYMETQKNLDKKGINYKLGEYSKEAIYDFYTMSICDVIISSPSTFSIWAGILGNEKKIIHSASWIENRINANDKFWIDFDNSNCETYKLWRKI
jgi:hypothetical protein